MGGKRRGVSCSGVGEPCSSSGSGLGGQEQGPVKVNRWPCHLCSVEARGGSRVAGRWDLGGFLGLLACRFGRVPVSVFFLLRAWRRGPMAAVSLAY